MRAQHSNLQGHELRVELLFSLAYGYMWQVLVRREPYLYCISGIEGLEKEESRSLTHELLSCERYLRQGPVVVTWRCKAHS
jgi:hypothetical protein